MHSMPQTIKEFPESVQRALGFYVYLYIDPRTNEIFYVGKGIGNRAFSHLNSDEESDKVARISGILSSGLQPRIELLCHGLTESEAFLVEAAAIDLLGRASGRLTNLVSGNYGNAAGRMTLEQVMTEYAAEEVSITDPVILILINKRFDYRISPEALYESTRGVWRMGDRREGARFALAVFKGVVHEVYEIASWHPAGTLPYSTRSVSRDSGRVEFAGTVAPAAVRERYVGKSVKAYLKANSQNPIRYINC